VCFLLSKIIQAIEQWRGKINMTHTPIKIKDIYNRLAAIGFPQQFVRKQVLPEWWCDEYDQTEGAAIDAASYAARRLNINLRQ
jgi:hypothetical protein